MADDKQTSNEGFSFRLSGKQAGTLLVMAITVALGLLAGITGSESDGANHPTTIEFDALSRAVGANSSAIRTNGGAIQTDQQDTANLWEHHKELEEKITVFIKDSRLLHLTCAERFAALETTQNNMKDHERYQDAMISQCIENYFRNVGNGN